MRVGVLPIARVNGERVGQLLRVGELRGEAPGDVAPLVSAQLLRQRKLDVFEQAAVGALALIRVGRIFPLAGDVIALGAGGLLGWVQKAVGKLLEA